MENLPQEIFYDEVIGKGLTVDERLALSTLSKAQYERNRQELLIRKPVSIGEVIGKKCVIKVSKNDVLLCVDEKGEILNFLAKEKGWGSEYNMQPLHQLILFGDTPRFPYAYYHEPYVSPRMYVDYSKLPHFEVDPVTLSIIYEERGVKKTQEVKDKLFSIMDSMQMSELYATYFVLTDTDRISGVFANRMRKVYQEKIVASLRI